jgi:amidophosphoribosyltransferase
MAVGHVRYSTTGGDGRLNAQPIVVNHNKGRMALAHNGNLTNAYELRLDLEMQGSIFHTTSDTEVISYIITKERLTAPSIEEAVSRAMDRIRGAYSLVIMSPAKLIAARDPFGFRPLCYGVTEEGDYVVASESCALDAVGASFVRDVRPGEILVFEASGVRSLPAHCGKEKQTVCVFEYLYFARPDSVIDGASVHEARLQAGRFLAQEHPVQADVVIGVPDSGLDAAMGYAEASGIPYRMGFIKNKYIGRTFIQPNQHDRENKVKIKLNPIASVVRGKRVVLVDDSIVRGTTSQQIVHLLRQAGATEIHVMSSAPAFLNPCYYGVDVDSRENLIAVNHPIEEIPRIIDADSVGFLSVEHACQIAAQGHAEGFCTGCFSGVYPAGVPKHDRKSRFEQKISETNPKEDAQP